MSWLCEINLFIVIAIVENGCLHLQCLRPVTEEERCGETLSDTVSKLRIPLLHGLWQGLLVLFSLFVFIHVIQTWRSPFSLNFIWRGNDYAKHTQCVSEEQKYSGKDYKPKPNANKGEVKQEQWIQVCCFIISWMFPSSMRYVNSFCFFHTNFWLNYRKFGT